MPSIVGPIKINSVGGGVINFGDSFYLAPKSAEKSAAGAGANNTGDFLNTNTGFNITNTIDPDLADQVVGGNGIRRMTLLMLYIYKQTFIKEI